MAVTRARAKVDAPDTPDDDDIASETTKCSEVAENDSLNRPVTTDSNTDPRTLSEDPGRGGGMTRKDTLSDHLKADRTEWTPMSIEDYETSGIPLKEGDLLESRCQGEKLICAQAESEGKTIHFSQARGGACEYSL